MQLALKEPQDMLVHKELQEMSDQQVLEVKLDIQVHKDQ